MISTKDMFTTQIFSSFISILTKISGVVIIRFIPVSDYGLYSSVNATCVLIAILWLFNDKSNLVYNVNSSIHINDKVGHYKKYLSIFILYNIPISFVIMCGILIVSNDFPLLLIITLSIKIFFVELVHFLTSVVEVTMSIKKKIVAISLWGLLDILSLLFSFVVLQDIVYATISSLIISSTLFLIYLFVFCFDDEAITFIKSIFKDLCLMSNVKGLLNNKFDILMSLDKRLRVFYKNFPTYFVMYFFGTNEVAYLRVFQNYSQLVFLFTSSLSYLSNHFLPKSKSSHAAKKITLFGLIISLLSSIVIWLIAPIFFNIVFPGKYQEIVPYTWLVVFIAFDILTVTFADQYRKKNKITYSIIQGVINIVLTSILSVILVYVLDLPLWLYGPIVVIIQMYCAYPIHYIMLKRT
jgi:O-antigen/teichoic acid export membrane protein